MEIDLTAPTDEPDAGGHAGNPTGVAGEARDRSWAVPLTLAAMTVAWSVTFIWLGVLRHRRFSTVGFDLGIYDQATWLLSRLEDPFITVRGLELFGFHANFVLFAFAPFYRLGAGPEFLLAVQVVAQASGALAVYLLGRDLLDSRWLGVATAAVLLLHPTYQFLAWEFFHPESLAVSAVLFAYWAGRTGRWRWFWVATALALVCKEDVGLAVAAIGVLVALRGHRRVGVAAALLGAGWYVAVTRALMPLVAGVRPFYESFFPEFGSNGGEVLRNVLTKPVRTIEVMTRQDRLDYLWAVFAPLALLPLFALPTLLVGWPMLGVNLLSALPFTRDARFHYSALVLAGAILASVEAIAWLARGRRARRALTAVLLAAAAAGTVLLGPSPLGVDFRRYWPLERDPRNTARAAAVAAVPQRAATSATYTLVPHLTHRERIYEFPVPWRNVNWGVEGENLHDPAEVEWLVVDRTLLGPDSALLDRLLADEFAVRFERDGVVAAERVRPPPRRLTPPEP